jgi:hypothetical protein
LSGDGRAGRDPASLQIRHTPDQRPASKPDPRTGLSVTWAAFELDVSPVGRAATVLPPALRAKFGLATSRDASLNAAEPGSSATRNGRLPGGTVQIRSRCVHNESAAKSIFILFGSI